MHNLEIARFRDHPEPFDWASRYETRITDLVRQHEHPPIVDYLRGGDDARLSVPTPDHYLPFLYILALRRDSDASTVIAKGIEFGSMSMLSLAFGT